MSLLTPVLLTRCSLKAKGVGEQKPRSAFFSCPPIIPQPHPHFPSLLASLGFLYPSARQRSPSDIFLSPSNPTCNKSIVSNLKYDSSDSKNNSYGHFVIFLNSHNEPFSKYDCLLLVGLHTKSAEMIFH